MVTASVYRNGKLIDKLQGSSVKAVFELAQYKYGHCLGRIMLDGHIKLGWRFAKCEEGVECIPVIYEIYL